MAPAQAKRGELALPSAKVAQHYLVLPRLMRPTIDLRVSGRRQTAAKRRQCEFCAARAAPKALRVILLARDGFEFLQGVNGLGASIAKGNAATRSPIILLLRARSCLGRRHAIRTHNVLGGGRHGLYKDLFGCEEDVVAVVVGRRRRRRSSGELQNGREFSSDAFALI